jgi:hypothetical protein
VAQNNSRYIQFYTPGSAAVKVQIQDEQKWAPLPEPKPEKKILIPVDPVAIFGFVVAVCMLVLMTIGINQLNYARREVATLEHYVAQLTAENNALQETYEAGYDLEEVRQKALDMGMVPVEEIAQTHIFVTMPPVQTEEPVTGWERVSTYLTGLFA